VSFAHERSVGSSVTVMGVFTGESGFEVKGAPARTDFAPGLYE
jgi:hypothetical protein